MTQFRRPLILLILAIPTLAPLKAEEPWEAPAALYRQGDYTAAYRMAEGRLAEHPGDATLIRLLGMCLLDAGYPHQALEVLREGIRLHPDSVAMAFYLAHANASVGNLDDAQTLAEAILQHAPDSEYAVRCREVLPQLRAMREQRGAPDEGPDRFDVYLRAGFEHDDNVPARAESDPAPGPTSSDRWTASAYLAYRPLEQEYDRLPFTLGVSYTGYQSWHSRREFEAYDVSSHGAGVFVSRQGRWGATPYAARLTGSFSDTDLDGHSFSEVRDLSGVLDLQPASPVTVSLLGGLARKDFAGVKEYPEYFDRDAKDWNAGLGVNLRLLENRLMLSLAYNYLDTDSEGSQFRSGSHGGNASLHLLLPAQIRLAAAVNFQQTDYPDFLPNPTRLDDVWTKTLSLSRPIADDRLILEMNLSRTRADSNLSFADYESTIVGAAISLNL